MEVFYIKKKQKRKNVLPNIKDINNISAEIMISYILKKQNKSLLYKIAKYKNIDVTEIEDFINLFLKAGYYTPIISDDKEEEKGQYYLLKKQYKNIKSKYISNIK